jgi:PST family polysaccharide transporter
MINLKNNLTIKRLTDNFLSLFILQIINYILPLFLIPYLIQNLGMEGFGVYAFIFAIATYGIKFSDYGFDLSATYHISLNKTNYQKVNEIFSSVLIIKTLLSILFLFLLTLAIFIFDKLYLYKELLFSSYGMLLGNIFLPLWFFQGIEKMRFIMYLNGFLKLSFFVLVILFIKTENDIPTLMFLHSITSITIGFMGLLLAIKYFNIKLQSVAYEKILFYLKDGWYIFTSKIAVEFYSTSSTIIAGFFLSPLILGYYALSVKIMAAIGNLFDPITRVVYPYLIGLHTQSNDNFIIRNKQLSGIILIIMLPISLLIFLFAQEIIEFITGKNVAPLNTYLLQVTSLILIIFPYGSQFTNMLITIKESKALNNILFSGAIINLILSPVSLYYYGVKGIIWVNVFIAYFLILSKTYYIYKKIYKKEK